MKKIILASGSPRRIEMMKAHGYDPIVCPADVEENIPEYKSIFQVPMFLVVEAQLVRRHVFEGLQVQYEKAGATPHSHLICTSCGKVKEVRDANFIAYMNARKFTAFTTNFYSLYVYGTCSTCARRMKKRKATPSKEG